MDAASLVLLLLASVVGLFGFVVAFGAPYLPTLQPQVGEAIELIDLHKGQRLYELGSGDGKVVLAAAKQGFEVTGYELNPLLVLVAKYRLRKYPDADVRLRNFWWADISDADGIFVFLLPKYMQKLDTKITQECIQPVKLISFAFEIPTKKPTATEKGLYLYLYS